MPPDLREFFQSENGSTLPATSLCPVTLIVTDMAVIEPTSEGLVPRERAPGVSVEATQATTATALVIPEIVLK